MSLRLANENQQKNPNFANQKASFTNRRIKTEKNLLIVQGECFPVSSVIETAYGYFVSSQYRTKPAGGV